MVNKLNKIRVIDAGSPWIRYVHETDLHFQGTAFNKPYNINTMVETNNNNTTTKTNNLTITNNNNSYETNN